MYKAKYSYEIYAPSGERLCVRRDIPGYSFAKKIMISDMVECVDKSFSSLCRIYQNGKIGEVRRFVLNNNIVIEIGLGN